MKPLIPFDDHRAVVPELVGRKFASLAKARQLGFDVPPAAAISSRAHLHYLLHQDLPEELNSALKQFAQTLDISKGVAVRSSAVREDLQHCSFAGQYRSFLNVTRLDDMRSKIVRCWQSADSKPVQHYTRAVGKDSANQRLPLMGVILQRMVKAAASGVAFGRHPLFPMRAEVVIEAVRGIAEPMAAGRLSPYRGFVSTGGRTRMVRPDSDADDELDPLTNDQWVQIAALVRNLENAFQRGHLDIEWAIDENGKLWLLQCRPITTTAEEATEIPAGAWTRKLVNDLWADRMTPFLAGAMLKNQSRFTHSRTCRILGVPVVRPVLTVVNGYLYLNCESIRKAVSLVPRFLRTSDLMSLIPDTIEFERIPVAPVSQSVLTAIRTAFLCIAEPSANPLIGFVVQSGRRKKIRALLEDVRRMPQHTPVQALRKTLCALESMAVIQEKNQWPYAHAAFFTWLLRWLSVDVAGLKHSEFLALLAERGQNITISIERRFRQMAELIWQDRVFLERVLTESPEKLLANMPPAFQQTFDRFLDRYGCRGRHRTLYVKRWAEAPEEVFAIVQALVRKKTVCLLDGRQGEAIAFREQQGPSGFIRDRAGGEVGEKTPDRAGIGMALVCRLMPLAARLTSRFLNLREELRFVLDEALYEIRCSLLALGQLTGLEERVMFLHTKELRALVNGQLSPIKARSISDERYRHYRQPVEVPEYYVDRRPVHAQLQHTCIIRGTGTSPGRVTGRARIVRDPSKAELRAGEILVAVNTDPGWTPILSLAGGMVAEEGGLLNHCSIVARELKVPAIVGVRQATRRIRDGALIGIDGGLGIVWMDEK